RLGELIAYTEGAGALVERAIRHAKGDLNAKGDKRFTAPILATISRVYAREAAIRVAEEGMRWVAGADGIKEGEMESFEKALGLSAIHRAQAGTIKDMDTIADALYERL
ncbi:MAG: acyl-CoA dehydrogenase, partial [Deltaproteobacteria bacterium]|nr:acyl-CoA dehydrogenase [Deltaproteobacteria bacterium]